MTNTLESKAKEIALGSTAQIIDYLATYQAQLLSGEPLQSIVDKIVPLIEKALLSFAEEAKAFDTASYDAGYEMCLMDKDLLDKVPNAIFEGSLKQLGIEFEREDCFFDKNELSFLPMVKYRVEFFRLGEKDKDGND